MKSLRRVLIVHPYGIGDLLFVTPILRALRLIPTVQKVDLLLGSRTEEVMSSNPHVDSIYVIDKDKQHAQSARENFREMLALGRVLKKNQYDLLLDFSLRREYAFFGALFLGIRKRAGFDYKGRGLFHNIRWPLPDGFYKRHVVDFYCDLAEEAGVPVRHRYLEVFARPESRRKVEELFSQHKIAPESRLIIISPGGGESWGKDAHLKRWPIENFARFAQAVHARGEADAFLVLGSAKEKALGELFCSKISSGVNLMGQLSLDQVPAVLEKACGFVGNDGGLVHMAHALKIPLISLYAPADPREYGPYPPHPSALTLHAWKKEGCPCYKRFRYRSDCDCIKALTPEAVLAQATQRSFFKQLKVGNTAAL